MVCITMDAHSRDIVIGMVRDNVEESSGTFQFCKLLLSIQFHNNVGVHSIPVAVAVEAQVQEVSA
jgi:hypothetical protein